MTDPTGKLGHEASDEMDEETFLANYRHRDYPRPSVTVDLVIFTVTNADLKVLLIKRDGHPFRGRWALPGGFVDVGDAVKDQGESIEQSAIRELGEECFGDPEGSSETAERLLRERRIHLEQLYTFGDPYRDPRCRVITVAHYALVPADIMPLVRAGSDAAEVRWFSIEHELDWDNLAFDHKKVLERGVKRIRGKIDYSNIAFSLLPKTFTVSELRAVHEAIKGEVYDRGNFRRRFKRMQTDGIIEGAPGERKQVTGRPAKLYRFTGDGYVPPEYG